MSLELTQLDNRVVPFPICDMLSSASPNRSREQASISLGDVPPIEFVGVEDAKLNVLRRGFGCEIVLRNGEVRLEGPQEEVQAVASIVEEILKQLGEGRHVAVTDIEQMIFRVRDNKPPMPDPSQKTVISAGGRTLEPKSPGQRRYLQAMRSSDLVVAIGPAGTGKTYLATALGVEALLEGRVRKIILTRPTVEAGEELGFLPGDIREEGS